MAPPAEGQVDDLAWGLDRVKGLERAQYDSTLLPDVARFTQGVAKGPAQKDCARRLDLFREFAHNRYADGGNARFFYLSLDQSHGLIADTSGRSQKDDIDLVLFQLLHQLFC